MTHYDFRNSGKSGRNRYVGSWTETPAKKIDLPHTVDGLRHVLQCGADLASSAFSHQDIAHWCSAYWMHWRENDGACELERRAQEIAQDVDAQWELFLANTYSLAELQRLDFGAVRLPCEWFAQWLSQLGAAGQ